LPPRMREKEHRISFADRVVVECRGSIAHQIYSTHGTVTSVCRNRSRSDTLSLEKGLSYLVYVTARIARAAAISRAAATRRDATRRVESSRVDRIAARRPSELPRAVNLLGAGLRRCPLPPVARRSSSAGCRCRPPRLGDRDELRRALSPCSRGFARSRRLSKREKEPAAESGCLAPRQPPGGRAAQLYHHRRQQRRRRRRRTRRRRRRRRGGGPGRRERGLGRGRKSARRGAARSPPPPESVPASCERRP
jgi:hypothetical protein